MTPAQLRAALDRLGLSQAEAARVIGIADRTCRRYVAGDAAIPEPVAKLIRLTLAGKLSVEDISRA